MRRKVLFEVCTARGKWEVSNSWCQHYRAEVVPQYCARCRSMLLRVPAPAAAPFAFSFLSSVADSQSEFAVLARSLLRFQISGRVVFVFTLTTCWEVLVLCGGFRLSLCRSEYAFVLSEWSSSVRLFLLETQRNTWSDQHCCLCVVSCLIAYRYQYQVCSSSSVLLASVGPKLRLGWVNGTELFLYH